LIRGLGVPKNVTPNITKSHTDIAPTVLTMLGLPLRKDFDGQPMAYTASDLSSSTKNEYVNVEFWNAKEDQEEVSQGGYYKKHAQIPSAADRQRELLLLRLVRTVNTSSTT
jgi:arylsulfatase A-like enzyme